MTELTFAAISSQNRVLSPHLTSFISICFAFSLLSALYHKELALSVEESRIVNVLDMKHSTVQRSG